MTDLTIKIGGAAGFGIMTTGLFLGKIATRSGYEAFEYPEYPSLIRGGHNVVSVRIVDGKVFSQEKKSDILVCLNEETYRLHSSELKDGGLAVIDQDKVYPERSRRIDPKKLEKPAGNITLLHVPFAKILKDNSLSPVMLNNIALGVLMHLVGADLEILNQLITETFARKNKEIIDKNIQAARIGFEFVQRISRQVTKPSCLKKRQLKKDFISPATR